MVDLLFPTEIQAIPSTQACGVLIIRRWLWNYRAPWARPLHDPELTYPREHIAGYHET